MNKIIVRNQDIVDGICKKGSMPVSYPNNTLYYEPFVLDNTYTDEEVKAISKFFDDWFKNAYDRGSYVIEVVESEDTNRSNTLIRFNNSLIEIFNGDEFDTPKECAEYLKDIDVDTELEEWKNHLIETFSEEWCITKDLCISYLNEQNGYISKKYGV